MSSLQKSAFISSFTVLLCFVVVALPQAALADDAAADFSLGSNPNGVWSYGWSVSLGSTFNLDTASTTAQDGMSGLDGWRSNQAPDGNPYVLYNSTANPITLASTTYQPGQLALNMNASQYVVVRWTAPSSGQFNLGATFSALSRIGGSSDVHILLNGVSVFDSVVLGYPSPTSYTGTLSVATGDHIDFTVGEGSNGNDHEDTTGLAATIVPVITCPNIIGTWSGPMNVANPFSGFNKTTLSLHVTDQTTNGCLVRGYLNTGNNRCRVPWGWFNTGGAWGNVPFTGTLPDTTSVVLNFGEFGQASAILDMTQTPPVMKKFILLSTAGAANGSTAVGDLTLEPSGP